VSPLFTKVYGESVVYRPLTPAEVRASGAPIAEEAANNWQFYTEAADSFVRARDIEVARQLNPQLIALADWLVQHQGDIPLN
jgi:hypothetical protein